MLYNGGWVQRVVSCDKGQVTKLKTKTGWSYPQSNTSGFSARPGMVLDTDGGMVDANSFFSWASNIDDGSRFMYGIEITDFGCYEIEAFTTDRNAGMPCRCIKGEDLVKWADFTDEETNKFPSTSLKWKTQKYESREEQLEKLNQTQPLNGW